MPPAHRGLAFFDMEIPLDGATRTEPGQCMLSPKVEARMLQDLHVQKHESVLEIGTGSGFMAALLAHRAAQVLTWRSTPNWPPWPRANLRAQRRRQRRSARGRRRRAAAQRPDLRRDRAQRLGGRVPQGLLGSLKMGGRLAAIVGDEPMMRAHFVTRTGEGQVGRPRSPGTRWRRACLNFPEPSRFNF